MLFFHLTYVCYRCFNLFLVERQTQQINLLVDRFSSLNNCSVYTVIHLLKLLFLLSQLSHSFCPLDDIRLSILVLSGYFLILNSVVFRPAHLLKEASQLMTSFDDGSEFELALTEDERLNSIVSDVESL